MSNKPDILAETIGFARSNAEMSTYDREAWEAHARSCEAAMAERDRLREVNAELIKALKSVVAEKHEHSMECDCPWCRARAALKRAEGGV